MKELSIEDKAKRYDEAIKFAYNKHRFSSNLSEIKLIEELFPELKEDEREIPISEQKSAEEYNITGIGSKNAQGKLGEMIKRKLEIEKQCEQKPADNVEPKFKVGDWVANDYCAGKIITLTDDAYLLDSGQGIPFSCEHNAHLWTIEDAQDGDLIYISTEEKGIQAIFHEYKDKTIFFHCYLCSDFEQGGYMPIGSVELVYPLQKTHYKRFFEKMHEAGYELDAEKKELKKIGQNPAWNEEDEEMHKKVETAIDSYYAPFSGDTEEMSEWFNSPKERVQLQPKQEWSEDDDYMLESIIFDFASGHKSSIGQDKWLKSLKERIQPQNTWKPSDEQINNK